MPPVKCLYGSSWRKPFGQQLFIGGLVYGARAGRGDFRPNGRGFSSIAALPSKREESGPEATIKGDQDFGAASDVGKSRNFAGQA
jgi:hypothetical protein